MRIISGQWRGRTIAAPTGQATRPTSDRAREGLFSMLASRVGNLEGLQVADLFAGSGALGLEALSRGAAFCTFAENDRNALDTLKSNIAKLGAGDRSDVRAQLVEHLGPASSPFDLVLMDPPYGAGLAQKALDRLSLSGLLAPGAWISVELHGEALVLPPTLESIAERRFGKANIILIRNKGQALS